MLSENINAGKFRTASEVAKRSLALYATISAAHGVSRSDLSEWLKSEGLWSELTPREIEFITNPSPPEKERIWMTWFAEALFTLLWSIGKIQQLPPPTSKCDTDLIIAAVPLWESTKDFIESAVLKQLAVDDEAEAIYNINWQIRNALRMGEPIPNGYDQDVAFFRHYALNWIIGYCEQSWDEITPDT
jgi:hypothetical protein